MTKVIDILQAADLSLSPSCSLLPPPVYSLHAQGRPDAHSLPAAAQLSPGVVGPTVLPGPAGNTVQPSLSRPQVIEAAPHFPAPVL
jgi:hypothetical protein